MKRTIIVAIGGAASLAACGQTNGNAAENHSAANAAQPEVKHAYCFFRDDELKGWKAYRKNGEIKVEGQAHVKDPRYKGMFGKVAVNRDKAIFDLTIGQNDVGYAMPGDWWRIDSVAPNSGSVSEALVRCGDKVVADLKIPPNG